MVLITIYKIFAVIANPYKNCHLYVEYVVKNRFLEIYPIGGIPGGIPPPEPPEIAMTSSILRIIDAASVADLIICSYTTTGSTIF